MDKQLKDITQKIGELTALAQTSASHQKELRELIVDLHTVFAQQSGALAVVSAEALSNRRDVEELKKKAKNKKSESSYWKQRLERIDRELNMIGQEKRLLSEKWIRPS